MSWLYKEPNIKIETDILALKIALAANERRLTRRQRKVLRNLRELYPERVTGVFWGIIISAIKAIIIAYILVSLLGGSRDLKSYYQRKEDYNVWQK